MKIMTTVVVKRADLVEKRIRSIDPFIFANINKAIEEAFIKQENSVVFKQKEFPVIFEFWTTFFNQHFQEQGYKVQANVSYNTITIYLD